MKRFRKILLILFIVPCIFLLNACSLVSTEVYVTDIKQTEVIGNSATYTVYYSDGTTSLFTVENGADGKDGENLTIESIKAYCEANKINFDTFLKEYLTIVQENKTIKDATNIAIQSAVTIWSEFPTSNSYHMKETVYSCGSGVVYKLGEEYSYLITNYHVVYYANSDTTNKIARKINIFQYGTSEEVYKTQKTDANGYPVLEYGDGAIEAEYVGGSLNYDLAVLKVKTSELKKYNENVSAITVADDYNLGDTAIAIGNPEMEGFSVTSGIISVVSENILIEAADEETTCLFRVMRIDTAINGGNSGGGLFDIDGKFIGIVNAKAVSSDIDNIAFAIPHDNVIAVVNNLIYNYEKTNTPSNIKTLSLNITLVPENSRAIYNPITNETILKEDVVITELKAGIGNSIGLKIGDIIKTITINETDYNITKAYQVSEIMLTVRPGDKVMFTVENNGLTDYAGISTQEGVLESQLTEIN